jgi:hypothetical protein
MNRYRPTEREIEAHRHKVLSAMEGLMSIAEIVAKTGLTTSTVNTSMVVFVRQGNVEKVRLPGTASIKKNYKYKMLNPTYVFISRSMTQRGIEPLNPTFRVINPFRVTSPFPINKATAVAHYAEG